MALTILYSVLLAGVNPADNRTHVYSDSGDLIVADFQIIPPFTITSTLEIPLSPANAILQ